MSADRDLPLKSSMEFTYGEPAPMGPGIVRLVANNPGPFTYKGTNTYLVGSTSLAVIDPGPDDAAHIDAILRTAAGRPVTHILITHAHRDHIDGADRLRAATGAIACAYPRRLPEPGSIMASPSGKDFVNYDFRPDQLLADGDVVSGADWELEAIHTPGHAPDHLCFALKGRHVLFSGDHVMAWNTSVVAPPEGSMAHYMTSLEKLMARPERLHLPAHGGRIEEPARTVKAYLIHRRLREQSIFDAIGRGHASVVALVPVIYPDIDHRLRIAAALSVEAHVENLISRGLVTCDGPLTSDHRLSQV